MMRIRKKKMAQKKQVKLRMHFRPGKGDSNLWPKEMCLRKMEFMMRKHRQKT